MDPFAEAFFDFNADLWPTPEGDARTDTPRGEWAGMTAWVCDGGTHPPSVDHGESVDRGAARGNCP
jgi:hypothetical protein